MPVPPLTLTNVLPPYLGQWPDAPAGFAPYACAMAEIVPQFGTTDHRRRILVGLIDLRARLRAMGVEIVLQWLDGSFVEGVEASRGKPPNDIDVMTFLNRPLNAQDDASFNALVAANIDIFNAAQCKAKYRCDHYLTDLRHLSIEQVCYWHSLFSHSRAGAWKGYLVVRDEGAQADDDLRRQLVTAGVAS